jgi:hypothetical protein
MVQSAATRLQWSGAREKCGRKQMSCKNTGSTHSRLQSGAEPLSTRRHFIAGIAAFGVAGFAGPALGLQPQPSGWTGLPARPEQQPLDLSKIAGAFDAYIMDPSHGVNRRAKDGRQFFASALESSEDGGLTCYGAVAMGRELRGEGLEELDRSLKGYFSDRFGLFLDGPGTSLCEYWYLMNITAMAYGLIRLRFGTDPEWLGRVERSAARLKDMAQQINYNFNDQGYDFPSKATFTHQDIYRQPDAVGGYSYVMLLAWKLTGKDFCLAEAKSGMDHYLAFTKNPWYEVPSGAMAVMAAARLRSMGYSAEVQKALGFVLDSKIGLMATGQWGGRAVDGLMAGFSTEPAGEAYSMESMVTLPYVIPSLRFAPEMAGAVAQYALNVTANLRWFYPAYLPQENQSRPDLPPMVPYERLSREAKGRSPYAEGDFAGHRSVYGGAYVMWLDQMVRPQGDPWLLRWDLNRTNFLDRDLPQAYLYYNPGPGPKQITLADVRGSAHDLTHGRIFKARDGKVKLAIGPQESLVIESQ